MQRDLMERLAAADPLRDGERLDGEAEREAEALLARLLATPVEPVAPQRPRRRCWTLAVAGVTCVAAAAFVALNVADSDVEQAVAARSVAAVSHADSVYHILQRRRGTGAAETEPFLMESWYSSEGHRHEKFFADRDGQRGRLLEEVAGILRPDRGSGQLLRYYADQNRLFAEGIGRSSAAGELPLIDAAGNPGETLRVLEARGALKVVGTTRVGDRTGYRLVSDPIEAQGGVQRFEYVVDSVTYLPLSLRSTTTRGSETLGLESEFLVYERLPLDASSRAQLDLDPHPDATCAREAGQARARDLGFENPCA
jgi:hypothetical protein